MWFLKFSLADRRILAGCLKLPHLSVLSSKSIKGAETLNMANYFPELFSTSSSPFDHSHHSILGKNNCILWIVLLLTLTNSLVGVGSVKYGDHCESYKDCEDTGVCSNGKCACQFGEDHQVYEYETGACLSLIGADCDRANRPGFNAIVFKCVGNAQCVLGGSKANSKYFGICSCKSGFVPSETYPFSCVQKELARTRQASPRGGSSESDAGSGSNSVRAPPYPGASHRSWTQSSSAPKPMPALSFFLHLLIAVVSLGSWISANDAS